MLLRRGIIVTPHSNKNSNVLNRCPRKDFCLSVGATYIYWGSDDRQESANKREFTLYSGFRKERFPFLFSGKMDSNALKCVLISVIL